MTSDHTSRETRTDPTGGYLFGCHDANIVYFRALPPLPPYADVVYQASHYIIIIIIIIIDELICRHHVDRSTYKVISGVWL